MKTENKGDDMTASEMIRAIMATGMTKWAIKNKLNVSWQTVRAWETEKIIPHEPNMVKIEKLFKQEVEVEHD